MLVKFLKGVSATPLIIGVIAALTLIGTSIIKELLF